MSDERLREAERRWKETGSVDDEARYLQERVRAGDLTLERLELAAYCGHEAARRAAGEALPVANDLAWVRGFERWGKEALVRVTTAGYRLQVPRLGDSFAPDDSRTRSQALLSAAQDWVQCPCNDHLEEVRRWQPYDAGGLFLRQCVLEDPELMHAWDSAGSRFAVDWALALARRVADPTALRRIVCQEVAPWALGIRDPLDDRDPSGRPRSPQS